MRYKKIEAERARNGMTKEKFATSLGVSVSTVKNWQSGKTEIPACKIILMSKLFNVSTDYLLGRTSNLILLDIKLPGSDGFFVCSQIRAFSNVPIIFVTSCNTDMDELKSIMLGGDAFITKPYNTAILLAKTASLLKKAYSVTEQEILSHHGVAFI